ncbi:hypothetical protein MK079_05100 [Candidatus Gracilibacteria bacterium]|nr:hypothetical protein [Candidatus Gracilibacteria bacterium]
MLLLQFLVPIIADPSGNIERTQLNLESIQKTKNSETAHDCLWIYGNFKNYRELEEYLSKIAKNINVLSQKKLKYPESYIQVTLDIPKTNSYKIDSQDSLISVKDKNDTLSLLTVKAESLKEVIEITLEQT